MLHNEDFYFMLLFAIEVRLSINKMIIIRLYKNWLNGIIVCIVTGIAYNKCSMIINVNR